MAAVVTIQEAAAYMHMSEGDYIQADLQLFVDAAIEYIQNATDKEYTDSDKLAKLPILQKVEKWYRNRGDDEEFKKILLQLQTKTEASA